MSHENDIFGNADLRFNVSMLVPGSETLKLWNPRSLRFAIWGYQTRDRRSA